LDRSTWRFSKGGHIGLSILAVLQLLLGTISAISFIGFLQSGVVPKFAEAYGIVLALGFTGVQAAIPILLFVSGVGVFVRSFFFGFLPALASAGLMLLNQAAMLRLGQGLKVQFVAYPIVLLLLLVTRYRSAFTGAYGSSRGSWR
jgi:hypothetical protein